MRFTKMHGLGNDYVYVDCFHKDIKNPSSLAKRISDRHFGVGGDGLILITPSKKADVRMRIFNADGSEAEMCGNGLRCVAKYTFDHKIAESRGTFSLPGGRQFEHSLNIETDNGVLKVGLETGADGMVSNVCVNMGQPILTPANIPVDLDGDSAVNIPIRINGQDLNFSAVSMGNPHAVFFCKDVDRIDLENIGPIIETHRIFPNRVNAHFVQVLSRSEFKMRTWERGSGITLACGTGACACAVAAFLNGLCQRKCRAILAGGELMLDWSQADNCVYMTGGATEVFEGNWPD